MGDAEVTPLAGWLRLPPVQAATRALLLCFPHAGGNALSFNGWAKDLPDWLGLVRALLPGRDDLAALAPVEQAEEMAPRYLAALAQLGDYPLIFYGHSLGAILAFDLARAMRRRGLRPPLALCVSGRRAPPLPLSHAALSTLADAALIAAMREMGGPMIGIFDNPRWRDRLFPLMRADLAVSDHYRYAAEAPLGCPIIAFHGAEDSLVKAAEVMAWRAETIGGFRFLPVEGRHFFEAPTRRRIIATIVAEAEARLADRAGRAEAR
ncbi:MAG TPA: thioesterase domain-containing protein [Stellaceae bacterium]|nr:thioesterase domain-containing protein [Stellaceae bacterium]